MKPNDGDLESIRNYRPELIETVHDDSRLAAFHWERVGLLCVIGVVFIVIVFFGYRYTHSVHPLAQTPATLR
jgi:hypothetical protein